MAEGSVSSALEGKMYNRAVRVQKCVYEALHRLLWPQLSLGLQVTIRLCPQS